MLPGGGARASAPSGAGGRPHVNVTSRAALVPGPGSAAYAASKAAVSSLTQVLAVELRDENILVNAIAPSTIDTAANRAAMPDADRSRWAAPADIAEAVLWLISPANTTVTGSIVPVYGRAERSATHSRKPLRPLSGAAQAVVVGVVQRAHGPLAGASAAPAARRDSRRFWYCCCGLSQRQ